MKKLVAIGIAAAAGAIALRYVPREPRSRLGAALGRRMARRMEHMMTSLPEDAPPKLVMSILPRLQVQNGQIISLLREQNELLRERQHRAG